MLVVGRVVFCGLSQMEKNESGDAISFGTLREGWVVFADLQKEFAVVVLPNSREQSHLVT